jgi:antitoxin ParD1/3/4
MTNLALQLPEAELGWARSRVAAGQAPSIDAYFADLARRDREQAEDLAYVQAALDEGDASGIDPRSIDEIFDEIEAKYLQP